MLEHNRLLRQPWEYRWSRYAPLFTMRMNGHLQENPPSKLQVDNLVTSLRLDQLFDMTLFPRIFPPYQNFPPISDTLHITRILMPSCSVIVITSHDQVPQRRKGGLLNISGT
jgi:hypothetical protein